MNNDFEKIRITAEDIARAHVNAPATPTPPPPPPPTLGPRQWGSVSSVAGPASGMANAGGAAGFFLQAWVYLSVAGLFGAFAAWAICEPAFDDTGHVRWGNIIILPLLITAICLAFAAAESVVERSAQKGLIRGAIALPLAIVLGFDFSFLANLLYRMGLKLILQNGGSLAPNNPAGWIVRAIAWMFFGITAGIVYGIAGQSWKKCLYGVGGGMLGAGLGGLFFDPISLLTGGAGASRCLGMMIFGASTGLAIGLVETALKDRWLYVSGGPLAGKQFILYKPVTQLGSQQSNEIYLFKDPSIAPVHARIELRGGQAVLIAIGPSFVSGQPVTQRMLRSGDLIQIGRYAFQFHEKHTRR